MEGRQILESWKEISDYLKRSIKTCQRWEIELELPVHRLDGTPSARVFAYPDELDRWMVAKLKHEEYKTEQSSFESRQKKKRFLVIGGAVAVLAVVGVLTWRFFFTPPIVFPASVPCAIFLPLENPSGDLVLEAWRTDLPHLITIDLVQSRVVGSWNPGDLYRRLAELKMWDYRNYSPEDMRKISEELGCNYVATGSLIRSGENIVMNLTLHDPRTSAVIQPFEMTCRGERGIFSMVDEFTPKFKHALNVPSRLISHDIDEKISKITTVSPEAFKAYCEADRLAWLDDKVQEASVLFRKAFEIDPEFGAAYCRLYEACYPILDKEERTRLATRAFELSGRLNVWARYNFQGSFYRNVKKDYTKAIAAYEKLLTLMNDDFAGYRSAQIYRDIEEYDKAISILEKIKMLVKRNENYIRLLAICYARIGADSKVEEILDEYLRNNPEASPDLLYFGATYEAGKSNVNEAFSLIDRMHSQYPNSLNYVRFSKGPIYIAQDDFANAEKEFRAVAERCPRTEKINEFMSLMGLYLTQGRIEDAKAQAKLAVDWANNQNDMSWRNRAHYQMAYLYRLSGNLAHASAEAEEACKEYEETGISALPWLHLRASIALEMGRMEEFEKQAEEIRQFIDREQHPKLMRAYYHLLGQKEVRAKNFGRAIDHFRRALKLLSSPYGHEADLNSPLYFYSLAEACRESGRCWDALDLYKKMPSHWEQKIRSGDIHALSFLAMAKIYDRCGRPPDTAENQVKADKASAIENYRKFLDLWKEADPIFGAQVKEAKERLSALEAD
jgi:tetratricopeptide (TPR) repeat protein